MNATARMKKYAAYLLGPGGVTTMLIPSQIQRLCKLAREAGAAEERARIGAQLRKAAQVAYENKDPHFTQFHREVVRNMFIETAEFIEEGGISG